MQLREIEDTSIELIDGDRGKNYPSKEDLGDTGDCVFLDSSNLTRNGFNFSKKQFISKEKDQLLRNGKLITGDLVMNTRGTIGNIGLYDSSVPFASVRINSGMIIVRGGNEYSNSFLFTFFRSSLFTTQVKNMITGSVQNQLPIWIFNKIQVPNIDLDEQERIVNFFSPIDQKIATNEKIIDELRKTSSNLYRYWFHQFNFPNKEGNPYKSSGGEMIAESDTGEIIPKDWKVVKLKDIAPILTGKKDASFATNSGEYMFFTCSEEILRCDEYQFDGKAVLVAGNGNFNIKLYEGKFNAYQRTYVLIPSNPIYYSLIYLAVQEQISTLSNSSRGSIVKFITKSDLEDIVLKIPQVENFQFLEELNLLTKKIEVLTLENLKLELMRDWLLPKFINKQISF